MLTFWRVWPLFGDKRWYVLKWLFLRINRHSCRKNGVKRMKTNFYLLGKKLEPLGFTESLMSLFGRLPTALIKIPISVFRPIIVFLCSHLDSFLSLSLLSISSFLSKLWFDWPEQLCNYEFTKPCIYVLFSKLSLIGFWNFFYNSYLGSCSSFKNYHPVPTVGCKLLTRYFHQ
jgi:hypothetical protein